MKRHAADALQRLRPGLRQALEKESKVRFAFLHGSSHQGLSFRDLDIAVYHAADAQGYRLTGELAGRLESLLGVPCDIHSLNQAPNSFAFEASHGELLVSHDDELLADWRERTWTEYFAFQPHRERLIEAWLRR